MTLARIIRRTARRLLDVANRLDPDTTVILTTELKPATTYDQAVMDARFLSIAQAETRREQARQQHPSAADRAMP